MILQSSTSLLLLFCSNALDLMNIQIDNIYIYICIFKIVITVHDPIVVHKDIDKAKLREQCSDTIYSVLPPIYHGKEGTNSKCD